MITDLIGLPYRRGARGPDAYDCYGLCIEVSKRAGIEIPEIPTPIERTSRNREFEAHKESSWRQINKPKAYCLVALTYVDAKGNKVWHAGVVLPDLKSFIHVTAGINVTRSRLDAIQWRQKIDGFYELQTNAISSPVQT